MFYQVSEWPHVAILDPRTGECLVTWHKLDAVTFCDLVTEFLTAYPGLDENSAPPKKKPRMVIFLSDSLILISLLMVKDSSAHDFSLSSWGWSHGKCYFIAFMFSLMVTYCRKAARLI